MRLELALRGLDFLAEHTQGLIHTVRSGAMSLESRLELLARVLCEVPCLCSTNNIILHLDAMNRQVAENGGAALELTEICARGHVPQIILPVYFPSAELPSVPI